MEYPMAAKGTGGYCKSNIRISNQKLQNRLSVIGNRNWRHRTPECETLPISVRPHCSESLANFMPDRYRKQPGGISGFGSLANKRLRLSHGTVLRAHLRGDRLRIGGDSHDCHRPAQSESSRCPRSRVRDARSRATPPRTSAFGEHSSLDHIRSGSRGRGSSITLGDMPPNFAPGAGPGPAAECPRPILVNIWYPARVQPPRRCAIATICSSAPTIP